MADPKLVKLIIGIHDRTIEGKIVWQKTALEDVFSKSFGNYSIQISSEPTKMDTPDAEIGEEDIVVRIFDGEGTLMEEVRDSSFGSEMLGGKYAFVYMEEILSTARRQAMGVEKALDSIIAEIYADEDIPF